jgi:ankyrin repeat protein
LQGHEAVVRLLVKRDDVEVDSKDDCGQTPLSLAAVGGQEAVVQLLAERDDIEADSKSKDGRSSDTSTDWGGRMVNHDAAKVSRVADRSNVCLTKMREGCVAMH